MNWEQLLVKFIGRKKYDLKDYKEFQEEDFIDIPEIESGSYTLRHYLPWTMEHYGSWLKNFQRQATWYAGT